MADVVGKVGHQLVDSFLANHCGATREEVRIKPQFGVDVSLVELPGGLSMALTSDPLSLIPGIGLGESAWLSVHLMANDMATTGIGPMYAQMVLNLPAELSESDYKTYWQYIDRYCRDIGLAITGGHTGFIPDQRSTIAGGGTFISIAPSGSFCCSTMAQAGDRLLLTKYPGMSSAALLAMCFPDTVKKHCGQEIYQLACESFYQTTSLPDALAAASHAPQHVHAMHDVTEGGVMGACYEMACASQKKITLVEAWLPSGEVQKSVCHAFQLDPLECIGAGSMLISCASEGYKDLILHLQNLGIPCFEIGFVETGEPGLMLQKKGVLTPLPYQATDPYWAAFFKAKLSGWK
ncbi:MAG: AIR synthase-related protein [Cytophagaceae bacterium]|jgi:hydrogenase maturation factor|nr:AIR synthase-related protein [Cytophagaceae bacterium]